MFIINCINFINRIRAKVHYFIRGLWILIVKNKKTVAHYNLIVAAHKVQDFLKQNIVALDIDLMRDLTKVYMIGRYGRETDVVCREAITRILSKTEPYNSDAVKVDWTTLHYLVKDVECAAFRFDEVNLR